MSSTATSIRFSRHTDSVGESSGAVPSSVPPPAPTLAAASTTSAGVRNARGVSSSASTDRFSSGGGTRGRGVVRSALALGQRVKNTGSGNNDSLKEAARASIPKPAERPARRSSSVSSVDSMPGLVLLSGEADSESSSIQRHQEGEKNVSWGEKTDDDEQFGKKRNDDNRDFRPSFRRPNVDAVTPPSRERGLGVVGERNSAFYGGRGSGRSGFGSGGGVGDGSNKNEGEQHGQTGAVTSKDAATSKRIKSLRSKIPLSKIKIVVGQF